MTDNQMFTLVRSIILAGMAARGYAMQPAAGGWDVARKFSPVQQGADTEPTVYVFKLFDKRHGTPQVVEVWDVATQEMRQTESTQLETSFQASIQLTETTDPNSLTPSDVANDVCAIMQSDDTLAALSAQGVGIARVADITNPYNADDRARFNASPSFDFVLTHRRSREATTSYAVSVDGSINRV